MKAIVFNKPWELEYKEVDTPKPLPNEVLVKIAYAGFCATDIELLSGEMTHIKNGFTTFPLIPGHEWSGTIVEVGSEVPDAFKVGANVTGDVSIGCGACSMCRSGHYNLCPNRVVIGSYRNKQGCFAEYLTVPYRHVYNLPEGISLKHAALIEPAATAYYGAKRAMIKPGDTVLTIGDGPIGQFAGQMAKLAGASKVLFAGSWPEKLEIAKQTGADHTMSYRNENISEFTKKHTAGVGADVIIESSGSVNALNESVLSLRPTGCLSLLSWYSGVEIPVQMNNLIVRDARIECCLASPNSFEPVIKLMQSGMLNVEPLITHVYPLSDLQEVVDMVMAKKVCRIKILLKP